MPLLEAKTATSRGMETHSGNGLIPSGAAEHAQSDKDGLTRMVQGKKRVRTGGGGMLSQTKGGERPLLHRKSK